MSFGKTLQNLRRAAGLTQTELAMRSNTSIDTLRNWEQDQALPKIDAATRLARALGVSLNKLAVEDKRTASRRSKPTQKKSRDRMRKEIAPKASGRGSVTTSSLLHD
jgi:transcriptional regulator with XRE-family HTH domain